MPERPDRRHVEGPEQTVWLHEDGPLAAVAADAVRDPADEADPVHGSVDDLQGPLVVGQIYAMHGRRDKTLVIWLEHESCERLIVEVEDPVEVAETINEAVGALSTTHS